MIKDRLRVQDENYRKILFRLEKDEDGYPPDDWESVWAIELSSELYRIANIPFFIYNISDGDIVRAAEMDGELLFDQMVKPSGNSVIRVVVVDPSRVQQLRDELENLNCYSELSHIKRLIAVDIPPEVSIGLVRTLLDEGEKQEIWSYEESSLRHDG